MTIEGIDVLEIRPDFDEPTTHGIESVNDTALLSQAPRVTLFLGDIPRESFRHKFKFTSSAAMLAFLDFFENVAVGRWAPFWMPSWRNDVFLFEPTVIGQEFIKIHPVGYDAAYAPTHADRTRLGHYIFALIPSSATLHIMRVTSVTDFVTYERLGLAAGCPAIFTPLGCIIGFMHFARFTNDVLSIEMSGLESGETSVEFIDVLKLDDGT